MKFGIREIIFVIVMLGLLGSTNYFVFTKANKKKQDLLTDMRQKQTALSNLQAATALRPRANFQRKSSVAVGHPSKPTGCS